MPESRRLVPQDLVPVASPAVGTTTSLARTTATTLHGWTVSTDAAQRMTSWNDGETSNESWLCNVSPPSPQPSPLHRECAFRFRVLERLVNLEII